ncbi:hypothetical protein [Salegentibacter chungangensis]|uniref:Anti-sigma factor n=1 Tax=Salegentibacter chungangensis TaxID=1335724 RepID=A0ABW3NQV2_9FLAO
MAQDIRDMFKDEKAWTSEKLKEGHEERFAARLDKAFPKEKKAAKHNFMFLKIAAVIVVALGVGFYFLSPQDPFKANPVADSPAPVEQQEQETEQPVKENQFQLSEVSPQFKKIEDYYLGSLNIELAKLDVNDENKALIDAFMKQLAELDKEYQRLNAEFNEAGANEQTVEAMVANLQLRLELLFKLKNKLKEINQSKNENYENLQA